MSTQANVLVSRPVQRCFKKCPGKPLIIMDLYGAIMSTFVRVDEVKEIIRMLVWEKCVILSTVLLLVLITLGLY